LVSVPKSGDRTKCANSRGLTLLLAISTLLSNLLLQRMHPHIGLTITSTASSMGEGLPTPCLLLTPQFSLRVQRRGQSTRVPADGCRYQYAYRQMENCRYRTVRTGGLGLIILIYLGKGYLAWYQGCMHVTQS
jgi:hypothetical protein